MNTRTDDWGGDVERRARLLVEIIRAVRGRVGREYPLWMRINAREYHKPDGETLDAQLEAIRLAVAAGLDAVHVTAYANMDVATGPTDSYAPHRVGDLADQAARVRAAVDVPVITFGRFEPDQAEAVLAAGRADFVAMGRKLLADPDLPNKLASGNAARIRPCLYQYRCIGNIFINESLTCVANAATGREDVAILPPTRTPQRVLVIGGGAAGLEAARVLAGAGHLVEVWEAGPTLGGVLERIRGVDPVLDGHHSWLLGEIERADVTIRLGRRAAPEDVDRARFDAVIVATGPTWTRPDVPGSDPARVLVPTELAAVLGPTDGPDGTGPDRTGPAVLLGGGKPALTLAATLRRRGRAVTLVEPSGVFGAELGLPGRWRLVADAEASGVELVGNAMVERITDDGIDITVGGELRRHLPAATLVSTTRVAGAPTLAAALEARGLRTFVVGDARDARGFEGITRDAEDVARELAG